LPAGLPYGEETAALLVATLQGSRVRIDRSVITAKLARKLLSNTNLVGWRHKRKG
jgi:hypothetical protein